MSKSNDSYGKETRQPAGKRPPGTQAWGALPAPASRREEICRSDALFGHRRCPHGHPVLRRRGLPRPQGRPGLRSGHPYRHHRGRPDRRPPQEGRPRPERDHPVHRRLLRFGRRRRHLHPARDIYIRCGGQFLADVPVLTARRGARHRLPHPLPEIFRPGDARQVPLPGGDGDHPGAHQRRRRRLERKDAPRGRPRRRPVRLRHRDLRRLERDPHHDRHGLGPGPRRQGETGPEAQHGRCGPRPRLHHRPQIRLHHLLRQPARLARDHPPDEPHLGRPGHRPDGHGHHDHHRRDVPGTDLQGLRPPHRHRRHRHGRHHRHRQVLRRHQVRRKPGCQ